MKCKQTVKMAAPAIVRVKRARTEQPLEALVVSSKRRKPNEDGDETPITTVLTFAGTVNSLEENVHTHIFKTFSSLKEKSQDTFKTHKPKVTEKLRDQLKTKWHEDRFKVVSFHRFQGTPEEESGSKGCQENITVVDVEPTGNEEDSGTTKLATLGKYEYDLYYAESAADLCSGVLETVLSVQPLELVNEAELSPDEEIGEDSDNEDDENNWRNDYPDEDGSSDEDGLAAPRSSRYMKEDDDDELMRHMERFGIGSGEELSSDEADEALIYGRPQSPFERYRSRCIREVDPDCDSYSDKSAEETFDDDD